MGDKKPGYGPGDRGPGNAPKGLVTDAWYERELKWHEKEKKGLERLNKARKR